MTEGSGLNRTRRGAESWARLHVADARHLCSLLPPDELIDVTVTSPPYADAVDYGVPNQIGYGQSREEYLADMASLFSALFAKTKKSGSLWLIVDTFKERIRGGLSKVVPLPFELAAEAERAGWVLHDVIIWQKDRTLPWSHRGRLRNTFEYVLFLVKSANFKYHIDRIKSVEGVQGWWKHYPERYSPTGVAPTNVWSFPIPIQGSWSKGLMDHSCPLPPGLVRRILELASDSEDTVCDPFAGVGTVLAAAATMGRKFVGTELVPSYVEQFYSAVLPEALAAAGEKRDDSSLATFREKVAYLRHSKLPRVLLRRLQDHGVPVCGMIVRSNVQQAEATRPFSVGSQLIRTYVHKDADPRRILNLCLALTGKPPLSKFGIRVQVDVQTASAWRRPRDPNGWTVLGLKPSQGHLALDGRQLRPSAEEPIILIDIPCASLTPDEG